MQNLRAIMALVLVRAVACLSASPVETVITMLETMRDQADDDMAKEATLYAAFFQWCMGAGERASSAVDRLEARLLEITDLVAVEVAADETEVARATRQLSDVYVEEEKITLTNQIQAEKAYQDEVVEECGTKETTHENRKTARETEITAIKTAITKLEEVKTPETHRSVSSLQAKGHALALLRASASETRSRENAREFLVEQAQHLKSNTLASLADEVTRSGAPFDNVVKIIEALIASLKMQSSEESSVNTKCTTELDEVNKNRQAAEASMNRETANSERLRAEIDELTAAIQVLGEEKTNNTNDKAAFDQAFSDGQTLRVVTLLDAETAIRVIDEAVAILKGESPAPASELPTMPSVDEPPIMPSVDDPFMPSVEEPASAGPTIRQEQDLIYLSTDGSNAELPPSSLRPTEARPEIFDDEAYQGMQDKLKGVFAMLQQIKDDFQRLHDQITAENAQQTSENEEYLTVHQALQVSNIQEQAHKAGEKLTKGSDLSTAIADLEAAQEKLEIAKSAYDDLKSGCVYAGASHEEREDRLNEDLVALKQALRILNREVD